jgi:hypothetical protein
VALPAGVVARAPGLELRGRHRFRYLLVPVYDAALWARGAWSHESPFALDIRYARAIRGRDLTARSVQEMRRQGQADEARLARWAAAMDAVFPDIRPGDRLVGLNEPGVGVRFHDGRRFLGTIADPGFARAFFDIWLGEATSEPAMRRDLLGLE